MKISVKTLDSSTHTFQVEPEATILSFKEMLSPKISIQKDKIRLIFKGRVLDDKCTVASYDLEDATIHAVERLPSIPSSEQPSSTPTNNTQRLPSGQYTFGPAFVMGSVGPNDQFQNITDIMQRLITSFQSSLVDGDQSSSVSSRINTASRFLHHASNEYNRNYTQNSELLNYVASSLPPLSPSSQSTDQQDLTNYATQLRRLLDTFNQVQPILNLYIYYIDAILQGNSTQISTSAMHPVVPETSAFIMHSLAHALHSLSDVLLTIRRNNSGNQDPNFLLRVARIPQEPVVSGNVGRLTSLSGARRQPRPARSQSSERAASASQTQTSSNPADSSNVNNNRIRVGGRNDSGFQLMLHMSTDLPNSAPPGNTEPSFIVVGDLVNPTPTTNSQLNPSRLIRATAGSSNSSNSATPAASSPQSNSNQTNQEGDGSNPGVNANSEVLIDNHLVCQSIFSNTVAFPFVHEVNPPQSNSTTQPSTAPVTRGNSRAQEERTSNVPPNSNNSSRSEPSPVAPSTPRVSAPVVQPPQHQSPSENNQSWTTLFTNSTIPIIEADSQAQRLPRKLPPFSDGYIAGSPYKKKKIVAQQKATKFMQNSLYDNFVDGVSKNNNDSIDLKGLGEALKNDDELSQRYQSLILESLRDNLSQYSSINPDTHPHCSKLGKQ